MPELQSDMNNFWALILRMDVFLGFSFLFFFFGRNTTGVSLLEKLAISHFEAGSEPPFRVSHSRAEISTSGNSLRSLKSCCKKNMPTSRGKDL